MSAATGSSAASFDRWRDAIFGQNQSTVQCRRSRAPTWAAPVWNSGQTLRNRQAPGQYARRRTGQSQDSPGQSRRAGKQHPLGGGGGSSSEPHGRGRRRGRWIAAVNSFGHDGRRRHQSFGDTAGRWRRREDRRPWSDQSGGNLARDAGITTSDPPPGIAPTMVTVRARASLISIERYNDDLDHDSDGFDDDGGGDVTAIPPTSLHLKRKRPLDRRRFDSMSRRSHHDYPGPDIDAAVRSVTSSFRIRMQPDETLVPMVQGSLEPWMR